MTTKEKVEEIEGKIAVDEITIEKFGREFQIYPWLKGRLFHKHITGSETMQEKDFRLLVKQLLSLFYGCWNIFRKHEIWAFTSSSERRLIDGKYYDKLFDFIGNESGKKTLLVELRLFNYYPYRKIASKRAISRSLFIFLEEFYGRFILRMPEVKNQDILNDLNNEFDGDISEQEVIKKYLSQYKMMKFWLKILPNPKVVYISVGYTSFGYIRAFKEKGIKVVEFQHGLMTKNHSAYYYKKQFDSIQFPDNIVSVGECEIEVFDDQNTFPVNSVIPVGSYILDHYSSLDAKEKWSSPPKIVFAMQDGIIGDQLAEFVVELLPKIDGLAQVVMKTRRTSPDYYQTKYEALKKVEFIDVSFYDVLLESDIHATVYSTTAIESLSLGRQNILINIDNLSVEQLNSKLEGNNFTTIVDNVEAFIVAVREMKDTDKDSIKNSNSYNIKPGYKANILRLLGEI